MAPRGPAMHHRVGDVGVKLETEDIARPEHLNREVATLGQQFGCRDAVRRLRGASGRRVPADRSGAPAPPRSVGPGSIRCWGTAAFRMRRDPSAEVLRKACRHRGKCPRNGRCSRSGTEIQSISRRTKSSGSLALIGPPKITAPAWSSSVSGSGSPNRGRLTSRGCPSARSALPTRPGVEVSWCRTISTGSSGAAVGAAPAAALGKRSTVAAAGFFD